jgi:ABC-type cobalamin/Fe3+-siderophores transport system ATPase subunit
LKLRYLHLLDYPPLTDVTVLFSSGSLLQRDCSIRFVVGVNGSGKSQLLRAVAEVFLALAEQRPPHFPVSLIYELGRDKSKRSLVLDCPGTAAESSLWIAESFVWPDNANPEDFENAIEFLRANKLPTPHGFNALIQPGNWPTRSATPPAIAIPRAVIAYTTGSLTPWQSLWSRISDTEGVDIVSQGPDYDSTAERPANWTTERESAANAESTFPEEQSIEQGDQTSRTWRPVLITPMLLKCALLSIALPKALTDTSDELMGRQVQDIEWSTKLSALLERGAWKWLVSVSIRMNFRPDSWRDEKKRRALPWLLASGAVISEPSPSSYRSLHYDLRGSFSPKAMESWTTDENVNTATNQGEALLALLGGVDATAFERFDRMKELHDYGLIEDIQIGVARGDTEDILRFEEFSDGEQMVLGRMALFHLLEREDDALLLLDEPETHFNDKWKREIVDIIDDAIGKTANDVLIATHSAIVLTEAFNDEIILMERRNGSAIARTVDSNTFASDPSAVMIRVFSSDDSIGERAKEFIEGKLAQATGTPDEMHELELLIGRMGSGFYRSELRTLLNKWRENA